jgi:hypothetical protein
VRDRVRAQQIAYGSGQVLAVERAELDRTGRDRESPTCDTSVRLISSSRIR